MRMLFHNMHPNTIVPSLHEYPEHDAPTTFTYSDAAFRLTDVAIGILHEPITF